MEKPTWHRACGQHSIPQSSMGAGVWAHLVFSVPSEALQREGLEQGLLPPKKGKAPSIVPGACERVGVAPLAILPLDPCKRVTV